MIQYYKDDMNRPYFPKITFNLKLKMIILMGLLIIGMFVMIGCFLQYFISDALEKQIGERTLNVAQSVANIPELKAAFSLDDPAVVIQPLVAPIREATGAEYIVVGNTEGIRYSHLKPSRIGKRMVGGDNERALRNGESYVSKAVGSLGLALRGKVPIISDEGDIIGIVSVGFLVDDVQSMISNYRKEMWYILLLAVGVGISCAILIANYIKKILFGLEPEEISHLLLQKETILQSTHEGLIAVDKRGFITMMNAAAQRLLFDHICPNNNFVGMPIKKLLPHSTLPEVLEHGKSQYNKEMLLGKNIVLVNKVPIYENDTIIGAVSTFRNKTEIERLTKELTRIKQYANALRAQTHEFSNKLYTILGLLQLNRKQEAIDFIRKESDIHQEWIRFLMERIPDSMINAILLGKLNQANELRVKMSIHPDSQLTYRFSGAKREALLTVLGNLIENAIEATKTRKQPKRVVHIFFTDIGEDVVFEIEDSGSGIKDEDAYKIFDQGFSTKEGLNRGIGLALANQLITEIGGAILLEEGELGGACFVITIPKD